jgi:hypothetical protein
MADTPSGAVCPRDPRGYLATKEGAVSGFRGGGLGGLPDTTDFSTDDSGDLVAIVEAKCQWQAHIN